MAKNLRRRYGNDLMAIIAGVAFFDDPTLMSGGWRSVSGEKAGRFNSVSELDPGVLWITNARFDNMDTRNIAHVRNEGFFQTNFKSLSLAGICSDIDLKPSNPIPNTVETLAELFNRILDLTQTCYPNIRFSNTLTDSIYDYLGIGFPQNDPAYSFQSQFQSAFQENSIVTGNPWLPGAENIRLILNRVDFAETVLSYPVPIGVLREVHSGMTAEEFCELDHPAIANVSVNIDLANNPNLLAYGSQASTTSVMREWATQPEVFFMLQSGAKVTVNRIIRSGSSDILPSIPLELTSNAFIRSSYSAGVLAENIVYAFMSKRYLRSGSKSSGRAKYFFPARAVYLRSVDRMLSFAVAKSLFDNDLRVCSYGLGTVQIRATEEDIPHIMEIGAEHNFMLLSVNNIEKDW